MNEKEMLGMAEDLKVVGNAIGKLKNDTVQMSEEVKEVIEENKTEDEILDLDEWDLDFDEKFPLIHVANLSGKPVYTRRMNLKDKSNFVEAMKKLKNDLEFTAYAIAEMAYDEEGNRIFKSQNQKESILKRKPEEILSLYLQLYKVAEPSEYEKYIENNKDK